VLLRNQKKLTHDATLQNIPGLRKSCFSNDDECGGDFGGGRGDDKANPMRDRGVLWGCEMLRILHCLHNRLTDGG
jgi:hypothetical protein